MLCTEFFRLSMGVPWVMYAGEDPFRAVLRYHKRPVYDLGYRSRKFGYLTGHHISTHRASILPSAPTPVVELQVSVSVVVCVNIRNIRATWMAYCRLVDQPERSK